MKQQYICNLCSCDVVVIDVLLSDKQELMDYDDAGTAVDMCSHQLQPPVCSIGSHTLPYYDSVIVVVFTPKKAMFAVGSDVVLKALTWLEVSGVPQDRCVHPRP